jgi:hypothetical protein
MNGEKPYFHIDWIMDYVFKLTPEEKAENQKYWDKDVSNQAAGATGEPGEVGGGFGGEAGGGFGGEVQGGAPEMGGGEAPPAPEAGGGEAQAGGGEAPPPTPEAGGGGEFEF